MALARLIATFHARRGAVVDGRTQPVDARRSAAVGKRASTEIEPFVGTGARSGHRDGDRTARAASTSPAASTSSSRGSTPAGSSTVTVTSWPTTCSWRPTGPGCSTASSSTTSSATATCSPTPPSWRWTSSGWGQRRSPPGSSRPTASCRARRIPPSLEDHYIAFRAHIRAKVACLRGEPADAEEARTLLAIAHRHLRRARVTARAGRRRSGERQVDARRGDLGADRLVACSAPTKCGKTSPASVTPIG